ncbi:Uncharacterised protein g9733 [Pycnogonum litorale]
MATDQTQPNPSTQPTETTVAAAPDGQPSSLPPADCFHTRNATPSNSMSSPVESNQETSETYVSPSEINNIPKAGPRKTKNPRKKGRTMILTSTPVRNEIELAKEKRKKVAQIVKKTLFKKKKTVIRKKKSQPVLDESSSSEDDGVEVDSEIIEGDFVIVKVAGKSRMVHYIARIDVVDMAKDEYEGIFLQKVSSRLSQPGDIIFVPDENDQTSFPVTDIVQKLPKPVIVGGSKRRSSHLKFNCNLEDWKLK